MLLLLLFVLLQLWDIYSTIFVNKEYKLQKQSTIKLAMRLIPLLLIIMGGTANIIERLRYRCVYDNLDFFGLFYCNYADLLISIGFGLLIGYYIYSCYFASVKPSA